MMQQTQNRKLLVIAPEYFSFVKDQVDTIAPQFDEINVLVRYNPLAELSNIIPLNSLEIKKKDFIINLSKTPRNVHIFPVPVYHIPFFKSFYKELGNKTYNSIKNIIEEHNIDFDCIHAHFAWPEGYAGVKLKQQFEKPLVITAHGYDIYDLPFKDNFWNLRIQNILNSADYVITVSKNNMRCIKKLHISSKMKVIYNGFREDLFFPKDLQECRKILDLPPDKKIIINVANLEEVKGHSFLIEAMEVLIEDHKNVMCIIIGNGALKNVLERQIREKNLKDYILLVGSKSHETIPTWINASDVFVLPSIKEGFGVAQIEALACGKPVVATKNGGSEELIVSEDIGSLVNIRDPHNLSEHLDRALKKSWNSATIHDYAMNYTWTILAKQIGEVYEEVYS